jgi:hypothetical protein
MPREYNFSLSPIVDEQTKAAAARAAQAAAPAAAKAIAKTADELMIDRINAQIAKTQTSISSLENTATKLGALNPSVMTKATGETNTEFLARKRAAEDLARQNEMAENPLLNKAVKPTGAPAGKYYAWIGGTNTGSWQLYDIPGYGTTGTRPAAIVTATENLPGIFGSSTATTTTSVPTLTAPTGPTLASDVFKQTLSIFFGAAEMAKPWVNELYKAVSKFYKAGATSEESFNMAVLDSRNNPALSDFTKRFKGIYALQDMKQAGKAVTVPTIAEYFATESKMGDVLKQSNLGDLANEDFLGDVLAKGVSATEFANRITAIFDRIDNSPKDIKDTLSRFFPTVDRISLAKAIALGDKGAKELQNQVAGYEVLSAAEKQGLGANQIVGGTTAETAYQYALGGETYDTALTKFGTVAAMLPTVNKLTQVYGEPMLGPSGIQEAVFGKSAKQIKTLEDLVKKEEATYSAKSGVSQISLASQRRAAGII